MPLPRRRSRSGGIGLHAAVGAGSGTPLLQTLAFAPCTALGGRAGPSSGPFSQPPARPGHASPPSSPGSSSALCTSGPLDPPHPTIHLPSCQWVAGCSVALLSCCLSRCPCCLVIPSLSSPCLQKRPSPRLCKGAGDGSLAMTALQRPTWQLQSGATGSSKASHPSCPPTCKPRP